MNDSDHGHWTIMTIHEPYDQFLLFGDSITQQSGCQDKGFAFAPALQDAYIRRLDVINRGFSGYTTSNALQVLPRFMPDASQASVRLMMIFFGANDACLPGQLQHVPMHRYCENLKLLCLHPSVKAHDPKIILVTPPPVNEFQLAIRDAERGNTNRQRTAANTKEYADRCRKVGEELKVPVVDLWRAFMTRAGWKEGEPLTESKKAECNEVLKSLLRDGLHLNPEGYRVMYDEVMKVISDEMRDESPENLPTVYPPWEQAPGTSLNQPIATEQEV